MVFLACNLSPIRKTFASPPELSKPVYLETLDQVAQALFRSLAPEVLSSGKAGLQDPFPWRSRLAAPGVLGTSHLSRAMTSLGASPGPALEGLHPFLIRLPTLYDGDASPHHRCQSFQRSRKASLETVPSPHLPPTKPGRRKDLLWEAGLLGKGGGRGLPQVRGKNSPLRSAPHPTSPSWPRRPRSQAPGPTSCLADCVCSQRQGVDAIFQTSDQCVYILGARKFFQINTA